MSREDVKTTATKTITEVLIRCLIQRSWELVTLALGAGDLSLIVFKEKLVQHSAYREVSFWLLLTTVTAAAIILIWAVRIYWRYGRFHERIWRLLGQELQHKVSKLQVPVEGIQQRDFCGLVSTMQREICSQKPRRYEHNARRCYEQAEAKQKTLKS